MQRVLRIHSVLLFVFFCFAMDVHAQLGFRDLQKKHGRVQAAYREKEGPIKALFAGKGMPYPPERIYFRIFKKERSLEVWIYSKQENVYQLLSEYPVCALSGDLGPKRKQGDGQVPEGFYVIDRFNPASNFHLSLGINYPNASDRILAHKANPGGDIFIHGGCVTVGCIPMTDDLIKELYVLAVEAKNNGQKEIPVHIFPARMGKKLLPSTRLRIIEFSIRVVSKIQEIVPNRLVERVLAELRQKQADCHSKLLVWEHLDAILYPMELDFWENLKEGYDLFEANHNVPPVRVDQEGRYYFSD